MNFISCTRCSKDISMKDCDCIKKELHDIEIRNQTIDDIIKIFVEWCYKDGVEIKFRRANEFMVALKDLRRSLSSSSGVTEQDFK